MTMRFLHVSTTLMGDISFDLLDMLASLILHEPFSRAFRWRGSQVILTRNFTGWRQLLWRGMNAGRGCRWCIITKPDHCGDAWGSYEGAEDTLRAVLCSRPSYRKWLPSYYAPLLIYPRVSASFDHQESRTALRKSHWLFVAWSFFINSQRPSNSLCQRTRWSLKGSMLVCEYAVQSLVRP